MILNLLINLHVSKELWCQDKCKNSDWQNCQHFQLCATTEKLECIPYQNILQRFLSLSQNSLHVKNMFTMLSFFESMSTIFGSRTNPRKKVNFLGVYSSTQIRYINRLDRWQTGSLNWTQFMTQWFIRFTEFPFHLGKNPMGCV